MRKLLDTKAGATFPRMERRLARLVEFDPQIYIFFKISLEVSEIMCNFAA